MTPEREAQIEARCNAASPQAAGITMSGSLSDTARRWGEAQYVAGVASGLADVPDLLATVRELRAERDALAAKIARVTEIRARVAAAPASDDTLYYVVLDLTAALEGETSGN